MKKTFEHFLLLVLLTVSILLGLTFWLNVNFGFNLFSAEHWNELASLQAAHTTINKDFYVSIGVAIMIFILGAHAIYRPRFRKIKIQQKQITPPEPVKAIPQITPENQNLPTPVIPEPVVQTTQDVTHEPLVQEPVEQEQLQPVIQPLPQTNINLVRPPKLNLPKNMAQIAAVQHQAMTTQAPQPDTSARYDDELSKIFSDNSYIVKDNPKISGIKLNLFAIGGGEIVWMGCVDCSPDTFKPAITRLQDVFDETLEDIPIHIKPFILDTDGKYESSNNIMVFHSIEELSDFIAQNPGETISDSDREDFDAYSDYIDTVLTMLYKM